MMSPSSSDPSSSSTEQPASPEPASSKSSGDPPEAAPTPNESSAASPRPVWERIPAFEIVLLAGGVILFLVLLYEMQIPPQEGSFLTPPLVALAGTLLLWPLRRQKAARALLLSGGVLLLLWAINKLSRILIPFAAVYLLAYLLNPLVTRLKRRSQVPRWLSSLAITVLAVGTFALVILILAPSVSGQIETLSDRLLDGVSSLRTWLASSAFLDTLEGVGIIDKQQVLQQIQFLVQKQASRLPEAVENLASSLGSVLSLATVLALVPVILFYTLKDYPDIQEALIDLFPTAGGRRDYLIKAGSIVGHYLRGQLMISCIAAFNVSLLLFLFDVPFWLLIGLMGGILNFIPQLGALLTMVIGSLITLILSGWVDVLVVILVLAAEGFLEQSVLTPNILSYQVGLHPLLVLFSLLTFGTFLGIFGLLIAVPVTAILVTAYRAYREELTLDLSDYSAQTE